MKNTCRSHQFEVDLYINDDLFVPVADRHAWFRESLTHETRERLLNEGCNSLGECLPKVALASFILTSREYAKVPENKVFCALLADQNQAYKDAQNRTTSLAIVSRGDAIARSIAARVSRPWIVIENINTPMSCTLYCHTIFFGDYDDFSDLKFRSYLKDSLGKLCNLLLPSRARTRG
jgi:hypothetical protein